MNCKIIATEIFDFAELLLSHSIIQDAKSLYDVSAKLQSSQDVNKWGYECGNLKFSVEGATAGTIPQKVSLVEIYFSISATEILSNDGICENPLSMLNFDIELEGFCELEDKIENYYASWHLDKHIPSIRPAYVHPEYHLTFGGNSLEAKGNIFGSALILPSPRIVHPPMDVILGIDFIVQNYFPLDKISKLLDESRYKEIVSNAQNRLWKPYYLTMVSAWISFPDTTFVEGFKYYHVNPHVNEIIN